MDAVEPVRPRRGIPLALVGAGVVALVAGVSLGPEPAAAGAAVLLVACVLALKDSVSPVFTWTNAIAALVVVVWFIPIRLYRLEVPLPFNLEIYRVVLIVLLFAWVVSLLARRRRIDAAGHGRPLVLLGATAVGALLTNIGDLDTTEAVKSLSFLLSYVLVFALLTSTVDTMVQAERTIRVLVGGAAIVGLFALYEARTGYNFFNHLHRWIPGLDQLEREIFEVRGGRLRVHASAQHPIAFGCALTMVAPFAVYLMRRAQSRNAAWLWGGCGLVIAAAAFATISRTTVVMMLVMLVAGFVLLGRRLLRYWPIVVVLGALIHVATPGAIGSLYRSLFPEEGLTAELYSRAGQGGSGRFADVGPGIDLWKENPVLGKGLGTQGVVIDDPLVVSLGQAPPAIIFDNQYLGTLVTLGALGIVSVVWLVWGAAVKLFRAARRAAGDAGEFLVCAALASCAFAVGMFFFDALFFVQAVLVFMLIAALGLRVARLHREEAAAPEPSPAVSRAPQAGTA